MNKRDVVIVVCRLLALWVLIDAIFITAGLAIDSSVLQLFQSAPNESNVNIPDVYRGDRNFHLIKILPETMMIILHLLFAYGLWRFSPSISRIILPEYEPNERDLYPPLLDWLSMGIALLGVYWFIQLTQIILIMGSNYAFTTGNWLTLYFSGLQATGSVNMFGKFVTSIIQLPLASILIFRSRWIAYQIAKWQQWESVKKPS